MNRRTILVFLLIAAMALLFAAGASAAEREPVEGEFMYTLVGDGAWVTGYYGHPRGKLTIPKKLDGYPVTAIDSFGLSMYNMTSVIIPDSVAYIGDKAFAWCESLTSVTIPGGVVEIGENPFVGCPLKAFKVAKKNVIYMETDGVLFDKEQNILVAYPGGREGAYAVPEGTLIIGNSAFAGCKDLTGVTLPESVTDIGEEAFAGCDRLPGVVIPYSVTYIGTNALPGSSAVVSQDNATYSQQDGVLFDKEGITLLSCPSDKEGAYVIPDGVQVIGDSAFADCPKLTSVTIPDSVTRISFEAFIGCSGLTGIVIPDSVTYIGTWAFARCYSLTNVAIPHDVTDISLRMFNMCTELTSVTLPDGVTRIRSYAFGLCSSLSDVTIPQSVTIIDDNAFAGCGKVTIRVVAGSFAEQYAKDNGISYVYTK